VEKVVDKDCFAFKVLEFYLDYGWNLLEGMGLHHIGERCLDHGHQIAMHGILI
jgi:hypothetical protein